jgi:hypothetical protein
MSILCMLILLSVHRRTCVEIGLVQLFYCRWLVLGLLNLSVHGL